MGHKRRAATEAEARALASSVRLRIIRLCLDQALTNKEIADRLGANPATTLHHVRKLVATGFLVAQETRRGARNAREVPYRSTGKSWTLDVAEAGVSGANRAMLEAFLEEIRLIDLDTEHCNMSRLGLRLSAEHHEELTERMSQLLDKYARLPNDPDGRPYSLFLSIHPDVSRD